MSKCIENRERELNAHCYVGIRTNTNNQELFVHLQRHDPSLASQQHNMLIVVSGGEVLLLLSWTLELLIN